MNTADLISDMLQRTEWINGLLTTQAERERANAARLAGETAVMAAETRRSHAALYGPSVTLTRERAV